MKAAEAFSKEHGGAYKVLSPYHKNKKYLPFRINGLSGNFEYPILVSTVEYKGWVKHEINTAYKVESLLEMISNGTIIKVPKNNI